MSSYVFKLVLLGQGSVGKTSLVLRYISDVFNESHQSTLQASFLQKQLYLEKDLVKLNIWDTAGQEKFHALGPIYYRGANGALLVYDVTNPDSLRKVRDWVKELNKMLGTNNIKLAIVGNKIDLLSVAEQRNPQSNPLIQEAMQFTNELINARHYVTSAKLNQGISELFSSLTKRVVEQERKLMSKSGINSRAGTASSFAVAVEADEETGAGRGALSKKDAYSSRIDLASNRRRASAPGSFSCNCWSK